MRPERKIAFPAVLSTEGRVVGICWEKLKPKGPKGARNAPTASEREGRQDHAKSLR